MAQTTLEPLWLPYFSATALQKNFDFLSSEFVREYPCSGTVALGDVVSLEIAGGVPAVAVADGTVQQIGVALDAGLDQERIRVQFAGVASVRNDANTIGIGVLAKIDPIVPGNTIVLSPSTAVGTLPVFEVGIAIKNAAGGFVTLLLIPSFVPTGPAAQLALNSVGKGGMFSDGKFNNYSNTTANLAVATANDIRGIQFELTFPVAISLCSVPIVATASGGGSTFGFAIYDSAFNLVLDATGFDGNNTTTAQSIGTNQGLLILQPGIYYFCWTATVATLQVQGYGVANLRQVFGATSGTGFNRSGKTSVGATAGVFPASIVSFDGGALAIVPFVLWEVALVP